MITTHLVLLSFLNGASGLLLVPTRVLRMGVTGSYTVSDRVTGPSYSVDRLAVTPSYTATVEVD